MMLEIGASVPLNVGHILINIGSRTPLNVDDVDGHPSEVARKSMDVPKRAAGRRPEAIFGDFGARGALRTLPRGPGGTDRSSSTTCRSQGLNMLLADTAKCWNMLTC